MNMNLSKLWKIVDRGAWRAVVHVCDSHSVMSDSLQPLDYSPPGSSPRDSPGKNTGMGSHFLLWGIFLTQGLNLGLPHCRLILSHLSHQGRPAYTMLYVNYISIQSEKNANMKV